MGMETISMLNVPMVKCESEKEECLKKENTSVAWLSDELDEMPVRMSVAETSQDPDCEKREELSRQVPE